MPLFSVAVFLTAATFLFVLLFWHATWRLICQPSNLFKLVKWCLYYFICVQDDEIYGDVIVNEKTSGVDYCDVTDAQVLITTESAFTNASNQSAIHSIAFDDINDQASRCARINIDTALALFS